MAVNFQFNIYSLLLIVGIAVLTSSVSEFLSWFLLYRKEEYKFNTSTHSIISGKIDKLNKKLEKLKDTHVIQAQSKAHDKKVAQTEAQLKAINQQMTFQSMKSNLLIGFVMIGAINMIGTYFQGQVIAVLPFEPYSLFTGITHRNIEGEDFHEAAYLPLYIITAFLWRANVKKVMGFEPPKSAVTFFDPPQYKPE